MSQLFVNMTPLKIVFHLESPAAIERKSALDSLLAKVYFNRLKEAGEFDGDYAMPLDFLKMSDGVYHTSWPVFEKEQNLVWYEKAIVLKNIDDRTFIRTGEWGKGKKQNRSSGKYKADFFGVELLPYSEVVYYVCGDRNLISELLEDVKSLGKKSGFGWGKVSSIDIQSIAEDRSILYKGVLSRNIPINNSFQYEGEAIAFHRLTHPYWERSGLEVCYLPEGGAW